MPCAAMPGARAKLLSTEGYGGEEGTRSLVLSTFGEGSYHLPSSGKKQESLAKIMHSVLEARFQAHPRCCSNHKSMTW